MKKVKKKITLEDLAEIMEKKFEGVGQEFVSIHERFGKVEATMEHGFMELKSRLTSVEKRLWRVEDFLDPSEHKINI